MPVLYLLEVVVEVTEVIDPQEALEPVKNGFALGQELVAEEAKAHPSRPQLVVVEAVA